MVNAGSVDGIGCGWVTTGWFGFCGCGTAVLPGATKMGGGVTGYSSPQPHTDNAERRSVRIPRALSIGRANHGSAVVRRSLRCWSDSLPPPGVERSPRNATHLSPFRSFSAFILARILRTARSAHGIVTFETAPGRTRVSGGCLRYVSTASHCERPRERSVVSCCALAVVSGASTARPSSDGEGRGLSASSNKRIRRSTSRTSMAEAL